MQKEDLKKEFLEHRHSWKYFYRLERPGVFDKLVLLEILKELQYLNDK